jgi:hypothetical protein
MEWLTELIKHTPEILKAASASDLSLAAFFFLVGAALIAVLLRSAPTAAKLIAIVVWLGASLVALLYFVHHKMVEPDYITRIVGQDTAVKGHAADLDLGLIQADAERVVQLNVRLEGNASPLRILIADAPVTAEIAAPNEGKVNDGGQAVTVKLTVAATATRETRVVRIGKPDSKGGGLVLRVSYTALASPVSAQNDSGPKPSGNGQDTGPTYTLCAVAPAQGQYEVTSSRYWLTGDRACNAYSQCAPAPGASGNQACFVFNMQGHSECTKPLSNCPATRNSEGHIVATFKLVPSTPRLTAAAT